MSSVTPSGTIAGSKLSTMLSPTSSKSVNPVVEDLNATMADLNGTVTWNDYGESHYISDINPNVDLGTQAPFYVDGFVHSNWRDVAQYYIKWFTSGSQPTLTASITSCCAF